MSKKGILVVSFGTSHLDTLEKTIAVIERKIEGAFPEYQIYRAFTSGMIIKKLRKTEAVRIDTIAEALERMRADGIRAVIIQPTHIINGIENDKMLEAIRAFADSFQKIQIGMPLLSSVSDYKMAIHAIMDDIDLAAEDALVLMGHGTDHYANAAYPTLEYTFHSLGFTNVVVGTVEGFPDLRNVMAKLEIMGAKKVTLLPFMIVAGDHAKNDMAGEEDSWLSELTKAGYEVEVLLKGLGELEGIQHLFIEHIREAV